SEAKPNEVRRKRPEGARSEAKPNEVRPLVQPVSLTVPAADALRLRLWDWGGAARPVVLLHGFGMSARVWDPLALALAGRRRVLALDARGHGDSDRDPDFRYLPASGARDLEAVVDHLGIERIELLGHSMGAFSAIRFAARFPERVERLVLVDAGPQVPPGAARRRAVARVAPRREPPLSGFASEAAYASALELFYPGAEPAVLRELARHWLRRRPDGRYEPKLDPAFLRPPQRGAPDEREAAAWSQRETERLWHHLERVRCPALVLRGARSTVLSAAAAERMGSVLRDARCVTLAGAGHAVMLDAPEAFIAAVGEFLR
nr:alpha/beta hydrolase [Myxococcota bacterium]